MSLRRQLEISIANALATLSPDDMQRVAGDYARIRFPDRFPRSDWRALNAEGKTLKGWPDVWTDTGWRIDAVEATSVKDTAGVRRCLEDYLDKAQRCDPKLTGLVIVCGHPNVQLRPKELRQWRAKFTARAGIGPKCIHIVCGSGLIEELSGPEFARTRLELLGLKEYPKHFKWVAAGSRPDGDRLRDFTPSKEDYAQGRVHRPEIADRVLAMLERDRRALVLGVGACGKSVLAWLLALEAAEQRKPAYILDLANYDETGPDTSSALVEDLHSFAHPHALFILDNCHLAESLTNDVMLAWGRLAKSHHQPRILLLGRKLHTGRGSPIDDLDMKPLMLRARQAEVRGVYLRLAWQSTGKKNPPEPPPEILDSWVRTFGGDPRLPETTTDLIAFSAAARGQMANLLRRCWALRQEHAAQTIRSVYLDNLDKEEIQNLMQLCVMEELEMSLTESSLLDRHAHFRKCSQRYGLVFQQTPGRSAQFIHYRLAHPALGSLILRAADESVDRVAMRLDIARRDPRTGSAIIRRLIAIERPPEEAPQLLRAMMHVPTFPLNVGSLQYVHWTLRDMLSLEVLPPTNLTQGPLAHSEREQLIKYALEAPLDHLRNFLRDAPVTETFHPLFNTLVKELTTPNNLKALAEQALQTPFDHLAEFLRYTAKTPALNDLFEALTRELTAPNHLQALAGQALLAPFDPLVNFLGFATGKAALNPLFDALTRELTAAHNLQTLLEEALQTPLNYLVNFLGFAASTTSLRPLFEALARELAAAHNLETLVEQALKAPLNHLASLLTYAERTTALKRMAKVLARELTAPHHLETLVKQALQAPLNHLAKFLSDAATSKALEPLFVALTRELVKPQFLRLLAQAMEQQPLDAVVSILRIDDANDLRTAAFAEIDAEAWKKARSVETMPKIDAFVAFVWIATEQKRPELLEPITLRLVHESKREDWHQTIGIHHLSHVLQLASATTPDNIERFVDRIATPEWIEQQLENAPTGALAGGVFRIVLALDPSRRQWLPRAGLSRRVYRELSNIKGNDTEACAQTLALLGAASALGAPISVSEVDWPDTLMLSKVIEHRRQQAADHTTIGSLESQLWHGLREMSRLRSEVSSIPPELAERILTLWLTTESAENGIAQPPHVRTLNTTMIAWLRKCKTNGWRLVPP